jgi:hypothetical protein
MNMRRLPFVMLLSVSALAVACGDPQPAENPPQPTNVPTAEPAPTMTATAEPEPAPTAAVETPPPPKPATERIAGTWTFSFEGDVKAKKEEELKKKYAKEKDEAKRAAKIEEDLKKIEAEAGGEWVEFKDGHYVSHVTEKGKDKVVLKVKYAVVKEEANSVTMKADGKPEVGKMDPKMEVTVTLTDDNTLQIPDPKKGNLIFKRKM